MSQTREPSGVRDDPLVERTRRILLSKPIRFGAWVALAGVILQLIGLLWDALMHSNDPMLAHRESVFSLSNPSHVMIMLGLVAAAAGAIWSLFWFAVSHRGSVKRIVMAAGAAALLLGLSGVVVGVAISTSGTAHDDGAMAAAGTGHGHGSAGQQITDPKLVAALDELKTIVRDRGTESAIVRLKAMAAADERILSEGHTLVHEVGRYSFTFYGGAGVAFGHCQADFQSGCYHGVLEAYFDSNPKVTPAQIAGLCDQAAGSGATNFVRFQCLHGLGHGVTLYYKHNLPKALKTCDLLATDWDRNSCYGGVFMENVVFAQNPTDSAGSKEKAFLKKDEPLYPCSTLDEKYLRECFLMQTSAILWFNNYDFDAAFDACEEAREAFVSVCYQSLGRDIAGHTLRDKKKSVALCALGASRYQSFCHVGVAKNLIDVNAKIDDALAYCRMAPGPSKNACYFAIGEQIAALNTDLKARAPECERVPDAFVRYCRRGAQLD